MQRLGFWRWMMAVGVCVGGLRGARGQAAGAPVAGGFVHPGILQTAGDLERIKTHVKNGDAPWAAAWRAFNAQNKWIARDYKARPLEIVGRGVGATGQANISNDCTAVYYDAIAWAVTGDEAYAKKAVEIMNAWSSTCREINGKDAVLCAGIYGYKLLAGAEIIRATYPGWQEKDQAQFAHLIRDVFYPVIRDFSTFANGNWDAAAEAAMISTGVYLDDRTIFDRAVRYYMAGSGDGSVLHYVIHDSGQLQETGRDQVHAQLGIGLLSCTAQVAWNQGVDLYGAYDNRLLKGFEYTAKYNLGGDVPFAATTDFTGKYHHERASERGKLMQVYEMVFNHYAREAGVAAPWTEKAAAADRPEPLVIDQVGAGTLLFSREAGATVAAGRPRAPGAIVARGEEKGISLLWPAAVGADAYTVYRAGAVNGPYAAIGQNVKGVRFEDKQVAAGKIYFYRVEAESAAAGAVRGTGGMTLPQGICAGLPARWALDAIGETTGETRTQWDGEQFTLQCAGTAIGGKADQFDLMAMPMNGDGTLAARYVPQTPSQFATMGLMIRAAVAADAPFAAILITPQATEDIEVPHWHVELLTRAVAGEQAKVLGDGLTLEAPQVTWGRLMAPFWLKLERKGDVFTASYSADGKTWAPVGSGNMALPADALAGMAGCSRIKNTTTVMFDQVSAPGWPAAH